MNYYYDIILNWSEEPYEFYEWNDYDCLELIKKIPLIKVKHKTFLDLYANNIKVDQAFLGLIAAKTLISTKKTYQRLEYACLFTDGKNVCALEFNQECTSTFRSKLLIDDELNVLEAMYGIKETPLNYVLLSPIKSKSNIRQVSEAKKLILLEINDLYQNKKIDNLKYLFYEYKKENVDNIDYIYEKIKNDLDTNFNQDMLKLYNLIKAYQKARQKIVK